jgi:hypothetical protein
MFTLLAGIARAAQHHDERRAGVRAAVAG